MGQWGNCEMAEKWDIFKFCFFIVKIVVLFNQFYNPYKELLKLADSAGNWSNEVILNL